MAENRMDVYRKKVNDYGREIKAAYGNSIYTYGSHVVSLANYNEHFNYIKSKDAMKTDILLGKEKVIFYQSMVEKLQDILTKTNLSSTDPIVSHSYLESLMEKSKLYDTRDGIYKSSLNRMIELDNHVTTSIAKLIFKTGVFLSNCKDILSVMDAIINAINQESNYIEHVYEFMHGKYLEMVNNFQDETGRGTAAYINYCKSQGKDWSFDAWWEEHIGYTEKIVKAGSNFFDKIKSVNNFYELY